MGEYIAHVEGISKGFSTVGPVGADTAVSPCDTTVSR